MAEAFSSRCNRLHCRQCSRRGEGRNSPLPPGPRSPAPGRAASRGALRSAVPLAAALAFACASASAPRPGTAEPPYVSVADAGAAPGDAGIGPDGGAADAGLDAGPAGPSRETVSLLTRAEAKASEGDPASLAEAAKLWEQAAAGLPDPSRALLPAARAREKRAQRADAVADEVPADAEACAADAWRGMVALDPEAAKAPPREAISRVGPAAAELLYLRAVCNGILLRARGFTQLVEGRGEIALALERVAQLAPDLDEAGAERELGRLYAALPTASGGDLAEARRHLEAAVERAPRSVRNRIAYATSIAVKAQDRALFEAQLHAVLEAAPDDAEAKELLSREDELFGPAEAAQPIPGGPAH